MPFFILSNVEVNFLELNIFKMTYILTEIIPITKQFKLVRKNKLTVAILDLKEKSYVIYMASFASSYPQIHSYSKVQVKALLSTNIPSIVSNKYMYFANVFLIDFIAQIPENTRINDYEIKLLDN